jgi:hypothetical protein
MTRISDDQANHLKQVERTASRWKKQLEKAAEIRQELDAAIIEGARQGISTHRLAKATGSFSQPRVFQIVEEAKGQPQEATAP